MNATFLAILGIVLEAVLRVLLPALAKPPTAEDARRQDDLRDRLRARVRATWGTPCG